MSRPGSRTLRTLDAVTYAVALTGLITAVGVGIGLIRGNGLVSAEYLLFWVAFLVMAFGAWKLRPVAAWKDDSRVNVEPKTDTGFQRATRKLPPLSRFDLARGEQATDGAKLLLASLLMLVTHVGISLI